MGRKDREGEVTVHVPDMRELSEEEMKEQKLTGRERKIEEAFYREASRMEVDN